MSERSSPDSEAITVTIFACGDNENTPADAVHHALEYARKAGYIEAWSDPAPAQAAQGDPVAWRYCHKGQGDWCMLKDGQDPTKWLATFNGEYEIQPLYAAQPQAARPR